MTAQNAPLTPPLTENDAQQLLASQSASSANASETPRTGRASTVYQDIFPTVSNLAIQNHLSDLIHVAETAEMSADSESRLDESRLLLIGPLVLSYIIINELSPARIALSRLPENLAAHAFTRSLLKLVAVIQYRAYPRVYKAADELLVLVDGNFFDNSLGAIVKLLVERHLNAFRHKTAELLSKAYTSLPISLARNYLNMPEDDVRKVMEHYGWTFDSATNQLYPPTAASVRNTPSSSSSVSSLSTVRLVVGGAAQFEVGA